MFLIFHIHPNSAVPRSWGTMLFLLLCTGLLPAQFQRDQFQLNAVRSNEAIKVDGLLSEAAWQNPSVAKDFWAKWPQADVPAEAKTEVKVAYNDQFLYISATCYDSSHYTIQTLKRDTRYWDSDGFAIVLDPVNQQTNGFFFGLSPYNVQSEDLLVAFMFGDMNFSWDNRWYSATKRYADHWDLEIAIPFKTLRYNAGKSTWGINFIRSDTRNNQYSTWTHMPIQFEGTDLGYTGMLNFPSAPKPMPANISLIPYAIAGVNTDKEPTKGTTSQADVGMDAKVSLGSALNLDLTVNPDFSQVDVDQQVTNLTRFNIFFPERRTFFLENDDLFSSYAYPDVQPYFSRAIGLDRNASPVPILAGARLTGNIGKKTRIGLMNMQTRATDDFDPQNYTAFSFNQRVLSRSLIKGYFNNRQNTAGGEANQKDYGRNWGSEWVYQNKKGDWSSWAGYHRSVKEGFSNQNTFVQAGFEYSGEKFGIISDFNELGSNFYADMGFLGRSEQYDAERDTVIRLGFKQNFTELNYFMFPKSGKVNVHMLGLESQLLWNPNGSFNERFNRLRYRMEMDNTSSLALRFDNQDINLLFPFSFTDEVPLPKAVYRFSQYEVEYSSDARKKLVYSGSFRWGGFYNGSIEQVATEINYRQQPWGNFTFAMEFNNLRFPGEYGKTKLFLIGPRTEVNFSNSIFWTTFLQLNTQRNNFNINSRLQWRFRPMSDLFVVYTDNYNADFPMLNKNRGLVLKLNYWWTL
jgi:hypothetical protein